MNFDQIMQGIEARLTWLPTWSISLALFALAFVLALTIHRIAYEIMTRIVASWDLFWRSLVSRTYGPARFTVITLALSFAASIAPLSQTQATLIRHALLICFVALVAWLAKTALHIWTTVYLRRFKLDAEDNLLARKHVTQTRILRRIAEIMVVVVAVAAMLMTFDGVRQYGVSLLASAGAAGLVVGLALQPMLKNVFAGIQLAVTQPIRIDDAVLIEGEWGNVEEITSTYVVIRLWDWRRMILPLSYFIEKPFQNWTRDDAALIGTVMIYLDYATPIAAVRCKVEEIAAASRLWDRRVVNVQVTDFKQSTMEVRILISAGTSPRVFDLRCEMREQIVAFLQREYPHALPRIRAEQLQPAHGGTAAVTAVQ
ncbi:mechanosensitive ion channel [Bosea vestrisii]|uniref:mechanosensitive ion channel family protein n=1 Tax=Bosea vestrisii TaxID=151416 RepID=UPI0024DFE04F|nr:mechanosensitive ion channel domain-containing protein [Bosea vestrisii]WID96309.1 mechanosensitive ion channel [Bosea vestrisii]